ncbi:MAG TPA: hypothetical protein VF188_04880 [Longimicrobiales bacterium]
MRPWLALSLALTLGPAAAGCGPDTDQMRDIRREQAAETAEERRQLREELMEQHRDLHRRMRELPPEERRALHEQMRREMQEERAGGHHGRGGASMPRPAAPDTGTRAR